MNLGNYSHFLAVRASLRAERTRFGNLAFASTAGATKVPPLMRCHFLVLFASLAFLGCQPRIGNSCRRDFDCMQDGSRYCDLSMPGGYCTVAGCGPTSCPKDGSVCVMFASASSPVEGCDNPNRPSPYARNYCMQTCGSDSECRDGYECRDLAKPDPWGAEVVQANATRTTVCVAKLQGSEVPEDQENGVCLVPTAQGGAGGGSGVAGSAN